MHFCKYFTFVTVRKPFQLKCCYLQPILTPRIMVCIPTFHDKGAYCYEPTDSIGA